MPRGEGIKKIDTLFEKYKTLLKAPQGSVIASFKEIAFELMAVDIPSERISYTVGTRILSVRVSGPLRSEIALRKNEILAHMKGRLGERNAPLEII